MEPEATRVEICLRIPGPWKNPRSLRTRLPPGFEFRSKRLCLPDGSSVELYPRRPDEKFPGVFRSTCRQPPSRKERHGVLKARIILALVGEGGSRESAFRMMVAGAGLILAGGAGVFIDNSGLSHGGQLWLDLSEDGGPDALSFGYVSVVAGRQSARTVGMHTLGLPDITMPLSSQYSEDGENLVQVLRYMCASETPVAEGHLLADEEGLSWRLEHADKDLVPANHPMFNPFGTLTMVSLRGRPEDN